MNKFVDRKNELDFLNSEYNKKDSSLIILYGRRRTGKTSLIKEFGKSKNMIYFLATEESDMQNREMFKNVLTTNLKNELLNSLSVDNWEILFKAILSEKTDQKKLIVLDEFQYLGKVNPSFPSIFQKIWDEVLKDKNVMVILCGSLITMMESQTLNYTSPLYGRRTGQIKLKQIPFEYFHEFFDKKMTERQLIEKYAITGGIPKYIESLNNNISIIDDIKNNIINKQSYLYEEPFFLLRNEVTEVGSYFSIIKSIAAGNRKLSSISSNLSVNATNLSKYLQTLINLDIIEREVPVTEINPEKSKKGQYKIKDNFISFWFKFIYPNKALLEIDKNDFVLKKINSNFIDNHVSYVYEDICRQKMWNMVANGVFKVQYSKIGRWWNNSDEIDIVGINDEENSIIFGECKYYTDGKKMNSKVLYNLKEKSKLVDWKNDNRNEMFILFSVTGYTDDLKKISKESNNIILA